MSILPVLYMTVLFYCLRARSLSLSGGDMAILVDAFLQKEVAFTIPASQRGRRVSCSSRLHTRKFAELCEELQKNVGHLIRQHLVFLALFHVVVFLVSRLLLLQTVRMCFFYQLAWLGCGAVTTLIVPTVQYAFHLSNAMIENYINDLVFLRDPTRCDRTSWPELARSHLELEHAICHLWYKINLMMFMPGVPFWTFALLHALCETNILIKRTMAISLAIVGVVASFLVVSKVSRIPKRFNSTAAYRGSGSGEKSRCIVACVRSLGEAANEKESAEFGIFLKFLQDDQIRLWGSVFLLGSFGIDERFVSRMMHDIFVKLPLLATMLRFANKVF